MRVKRDILRRSAIGAMFTNRSESSDRGRCVEPGATASDGVFNLLRLPDLGGYYALTDTNGLRGRRDSYQARFDLAPDKYGLQLEHVKVGDDFNPEVGFLRRPELQAQLRRGAIQPQAAALGHPAVHDDAPVSSYIEGAPRAGSRRGSRTGASTPSVRTATSFQSMAATNYELLPGPFTVAPGVVIPPGGYDFNDATLRYSFGQQRRVSGQVAYQVGEFYDGTITRSR